LAVWDVKSGNLLRTFPTTNDEVDDPLHKRQMQWPALKWSADDKYVAKVTSGQQISVYELPSMGLQGKKSIKIEGVVDFEWCPQGDKDREDAEIDAKGGKGPKKARENMLAYWTPEVANQPARVTLIGFPSRDILRQTNLFNVTEVGLIIYLQSLTILISQSCSVNCTGKITVISFVSKLIVTPKQRSRYSVTWRSSVYAKRAIRWKLWSLKVSTYSSEAIECLPHFPRRHRDRLLLGAQRRTLRHRI
jgi:hypothetical protein